MLRIILPCALAVIFAMPAKADETLKFRVAQHFTSNQTQQVGDVNGHIMGLSRVPGIVFFSDGSIGTSVVIGTFDVVNPGEGGTANGYEIINFNDGSELFLKYTTAVTYDARGKVALKSTFIVTGGKGRYAGAKGDGTGDGGQTRSVAVGGAASASEALGYGDFVVNIKQ
jgi:hypothetical protein